MKKFLLVFLALATVISPGVKAETSFRNTELAAAVTELAETNAKKVIFSTRPEGKVNTVLEDKDFEGALSQLLSGTPYQFTKKGSYYLVGKFEPGSLEFASHSERLIYKPRYLPAKELAQSLSIPEIRVEVLEETGHLLLQGLPEDLTRAERAIQKLDSEDNPYQVRFELTVIDIKQLKGREFELSAAELGSDTSGPLEFITSGQAIELLTADVFDLIEVTAKRSNEKNKSVARPSLVTALGETGSFSFSREVIYGGGWVDGLESAGLTTTITPIRKTRPEEEVKTSLELSVEGSSEFSTTTWLKPGKRTFLGLLNLNQNYSNNSQFSHSSRQEERTLALYITASPVGTLPEEKTHKSSLESERVSKRPAMEMGGLGQLLFPEGGYDFFSGRGSLQFLFDGSLDLSLEDSGKGSGLEFVSGETNGYLSFSFDFPMNEALQLEGRYTQLPGEGQKAALGLTDRFEFGPRLTLGVAYYPLIYQFAKGIWNNPGGWVKLEYLSDQFFANILYASRLEPDELKAELGVKLPTSFYLVGRAVGTLDIGFYRYLVGLRVDF
ncbi:hypothetical protein KGY77_11435 [Candidatus Bipolaricaulota bacterium]|nr:hypothetical protein [Candidatus Bipolaricaulota bacterium]